MKRRLWIGIGAVVLLVGGWLGYRQFVPETPSISRLVPPGALMVLTSDQLQDTVSAQTLRNEISLQQIPIFDQARQRLGRFLYSTADSATVLNFTADRTIRYSLHSVSKTTLDFIFYIPITAKDGPFLNRLTNPDPRQYRVLNHTFAGEKILDLVSRAGEPVGSFILTDGFLVGSVSGILIENVARRMNRTLPWTRTESLLRFATENQLRRRPYSEFVGSGPKSSSRYLIMWVHWCGCFCPKN